MKRLMLFVLAFTASAFADTSIGNGGDTLSYFLETARSNYVRAAKSFLASDQTDLLCNDDPSLNSEQRAECRDFISSTIPQSLVLNFGSSKTPFLLRPEVILVDGPDGQPRPVDARTTLGPDGPVEFQYDRIRNASPFQLFQLIAHEFGHKTRYGDRYLTDNEATKNFASGRELLDAAAATLARYAIRLRLIGRDFSLFDYFSCKLSFEGSPRPVLFYSPGKRDFFSNGNFTEYETGIGRNSRDTNVGFLETEDTKIFLRITIREPNGCQQDSTDRSTRIEWIRQRAQPGDTQEEIAATELMIGRNPLCGNQSKTLTTQFTGVKAVCEYAGTNGDMAPGMNDR